MGRDELNVNDDQPIDSVVGNLIESIARKGRGFVLDLANGDTADKSGLKIEVKESLKPHDTYRPPADYRKHVLQTTDSFIAYALRYGDKDKSLVFFSESRETLVIDEGVTLGQRETIDMPIRTSVDWNAWSQWLGKPVAHKQLLEFLLAHEENLADPTILASMQKVKVTSTVNYESDIQDDGKAVGVFFKSQKGEEMLKFPKQFGVVLPVLESDEGGDILDKATIRLEIGMPNRPDEQVKFTLYCSGWRRILKERIEREGQAIAEALAGWTVVHGTYGTTPHELAKA